MFGCVTADDLIAALMAAWIANVSKETALLGRHAAAEPHLRERLVRHSDGPHLHALFPRGDLWPLQLDHGRFRGEDDGGCEERRAEAAQSPRQPARAGRAENAAARVALLPRKQRLGHRGTDARAQFPGLVRGRRPFLELFRLALGAG